MAAASKFMLMRMKPPGPAAPGLNSSKYLSMGTAFNMSSMKIPAQATETFRGSQNTELEKVQLNL